MKEDPKILHVIALHERYNSIGTGWIDILTLLSKCKETKKVIWYLHEIICFETDRMLVIRLLNLKILTIFTLEFDIRF